MYGTTPNHINVVPLETISVGFGCLLQNVIVLSFKFGLLLLICKGYAIDINNRSCNVAFSIL